MVGGANSHRLEFSSDRNGEYNFLLLSDVHLDNEKCNRGLLAEHLQEAKHKDALVLLNGDTLDAMGGKTDVRSCKRALKEAHISDEYYFDNIVDDAVGFFTKHAGTRLAWAGLGNHETKIAKHFEFNIMRMFLDRYNAGVPADKIAAMGAYQSYIIMRFLRIKGSGSASYSIMAHHGWGGGGRSGKGMGQFHDMMAQIGGGIDAIWMGHVHQQYVVSLPVLELNHMFTEVTRNVLGIRTSTYKEEVMGANSHGRGWAIETGKPIKPMGGAMLTIKHTPKTNSVKASVQLLGQ